jgi:hypothetical protein
MSLTPDQDARELQEQTSLASKQALCRGCRDDFYNDHNDIGVKQCWSLKDAQVVPRYKLHWWTQQDTARNFTLVTTLSCYHRPGEFAFMKDLPEHLRHERHLVRKEKP